MRTDTSAAEVVWRVRLCLRKERPLVPELNRYVHAAAEISMELVRDVAVFLSSYSTETNVLSPMDIQWQDHIESSPEVLKGKPRVKGTRIPVSLILGYLASGSSPAEIIEEFPDLTAEDISACLVYARDLSDFEVAA